MNIIDMAKHYRKLQTCLQVGSHDASALLKEDAIFDEHLAPVNRDKRYEAFFEQHTDEFDAITKQLLEILCAHFLIVLERQVADQLPGGEQSQRQETTEAREAAANVPKTNIVSERDFAQLDLQLRIKPSARMVTHEALIMWKNNKTVLWLESLPVKEKEKLLADARKSATGWIAQRHKERKAYVVARRAEKLKEKQEKKEKAKQKEKERAGDLVSCINNLVRLGGVWTSVVQMDQILSVLVDPKEAVISQLRFHKAAGSKAPKPYYFQTETKAGGERKVCSCDELQSHLREVIELNDLGGSTSSNPNEHHYFRQIENWQQRVAEEKTKLGNKLNQARMKQQAHSSPITA